MGGNGEEVIIGFEKYVMLDSGGLERRTSSVSGDIFRGNGYIYMQILSGMVSRLQEFCYRWNI